jgi:GDSL-like Lipase/Acylhydrolase family
VRTKRSLTLFAFSLLIAGALVGGALYKDSKSEGLRTERLAGQTSDYQAEVAAQRAAGFFRAGVILTTTFAVLIFLVSFAPRPIRLVAGNLIVFILLLLFIELTTQVLGIHVPAIGRPGLSGDFGLWVYDGTKGWFHATSTKAESYFGGPDRGMVRINSLGLRGGEPGLEGSGTLRILVFGDSYVFGVGVDEDHLFTTHLERLLEPYFVNGLEVVNMGIAGYSTDQELILWRELGVQLDPDVVILVVCDNDYLANSENFAWRQYYKPYFDIDDQDRLQLRNVPVPRLSRFQRVKLWLGRESNVWNFVRSRESDNPLLERFVQAFQVDVSRAPRRPYRTTRAIVKTFVEEVRDAGAWVLVTSTGRRGENPAAFATLSPVLVEQRVDRLDLLPVLEAARTSEPNRYWDFPGDTHWNRDAHEVAAEAVFAYLRDHYLEMESAP